MDPIVSILVPIALIIIGYTVGSAKIINEGNEALVERLGKYQRKLTPGLNFIIPFIDNVVLEDTTRERLIDIEPQQAFTKDNVSLQIDAVVYWKVEDLEKAYYSVQDIENAIEKLVLSMLRSTTGEMELTEVYTSRSQISEALSKDLNQETSHWGVKVLRVDVLEIKLERNVQEALELERAAKSKKQAAILEAQGTVESVQLLTQALQSNPISKDILAFLVAQRYVDASQDLSASPNSKVIFMDPKALTEAVTNLMGDAENPPTNPNPGNPTP